MAFEGVIVALPAMSSVAPSFNVTPSASSAGSVTDSTEIRCSRTSTSKCECLPPTLIVTIARPGFTAFTTPASSTETVSGSDDS